MDQDSDDVLDDLIRASARMLRLDIEPDWMPAIRQNLSVSYRLASLVEDFAMEDGLEPAPVFEA